MLESKFLRTLLLAVVIVGGIWLLVNRDQISQPGDIVALVKKTVADWTESANPESNPDLEPTGNHSVYPTSPTLESGNRPVAIPASHPTPSNAGTVEGVIRVGSLKVNRRPAGESSLIDVAADLCRQYDVMVLQNLDRNETAWVKTLVLRMNQLGAVGAQHLAPLPNGLRSDYVAISDRQQRTGPTQTVILFNQQTVEMDQRHWYIVTDQANAFEHDPMVASFRTRGVDRSRAFTFSLAAIAIHSQRPDLELNRLSTMIRAIRSDGRGEDDVILVGDFQSDERGLDAIKNQAGLSWVVNSQPTTVRGDRQFDNIVFGQPATNEFTGRGGVVEFPRLLNMPPELALQITDRLPVWAEFSVYESGTGAGAIPGRIAQQQDGDQR